MSFGVEGFSKKKKEKNVFKSLFGGSSDDSESESSTNEEDDEHQHDGESELRAPDEDALTDSSPIVEQTSDISYYQSTVHGEMHPLRVTIREKKVLGIAHQVWPAAGYLCDYILSHPNEMIKHCGSDETKDSRTSCQLDILELGAGVGLTGIYLAAFLNNHKLTPQNQEISVENSTERSNDKVLLVDIEIGQVVCTDIKEAIAGIRDNIDLNHTLLTRRDSGQLCLEADSNTEKHIETGKIDCDYGKSVIVAAEELFWGKADHVHALMRKYFPQSMDPALGKQQLAQPLVIAADVVYWECLFQPLVETLQILCHTYHCHVIIAHFKRWKKDGKFFALCKKYKLEVIVLEEKITKERDIHHNNPDNEEMKKTIQRIYRIQAAP